MTHLHASQIEQGRTILLIIHPPLAPGGHGVEDDGDPVEGGVAADEPGAVGDGLPAQLPHVSLVLQPLVVPLDPVTPGHCKQNALLLVGPDCGGKFSYSLHDSL